MDHLAQGLKRRRPEALAELYKFYSSRTLSAIYYIVRNRATAEDLLQETFWRVWISADKFDPRKGTVLTWLLAIARNQALDYIRSGDGRKSRQSCQLREDSFWAVDLKINVVTRTKCPRLCKAMKQLTTNQQALIELAYFQGLSQSEIAARLGRPLGTIKSWMRATLQSLRRQLQ